MTFAPRFRSRRRLQVVTARIAPLRMIASQAIGLPSALVSILRSAFFLLSAAAVERLIAIGAPRTSTTPQGRHLAVRSGLAPRGDLRRYPSSVPSLSRGRRASDGILPKQHAPPFD